MYSLGERYGLRIIPGKNAFLVLPNYISRSTAVGAILHAGGPTYSPRAPWILPEESESIAHAKDFVLAIGRDEKLLRGLGELDNASWPIGRGEGEHRLGRRSPSHCRPRRDVPTGHGRDSRAPTRQRSR